MIQKILLILLCLASLAILGLSVVHTSLAQNTSTSSSATPIDPKLRARIEEFYSLLQNHRMTTFLVYQKIPKFFHSRDDHEVFIALFLEFLEKNRITDKKFIHYSIEGIQPDNTATKAMVTLRFTCPSILWFTKTLELKEQNWVKIGDEWYAMPPQVS
jgi:hypothetical protein